MWERGGRNRAKTDFEPALLKVKRVFGPRRMVSPQAPPEMQLVRQGQSLHENQDGQINTNDSKVIEPAQADYADYYIKDINQDGHLDVLVNESSTLYWYLNEDGLGNFGEKQVLFNQIYGFSLGDLDNDGDLDIINYIPINRGRLTWQKNYSEKVKIFI